MFNLSKKLVLCLILMTTLSILPKKSILPTNYNHHNPRTINTPLGSYTITNTLLLDLFEHRIIQRMELLNVCGPAASFNEWPTISCYDHACATIVLLNRFNMPIEDLVVAFLRQAIKPVLTTSTNLLLASADPYGQNEVFAKWFFDHMEITPLLQASGADAHTVALQLFHTPLVWQTDESALSAAQISLTLLSGLKVGLCTQETIATILNNLQIKGDKWSFSSETAAELYATVSADLVDSTWIRIQPYAISYWIFQALKQALAREAITAEQLHTATDSKIMQILNEHSDPYIKNKLKYCASPNAYASKSRDVATTHAILPFFRIAADPLVERTPDTFKNFSQFNVQYKKRLDRLSALARNGITLTFTDPS